VTDSPQIEKRLIEYTNLVQSLINCPLGQEEAILRANPDLVDVGFVQFLDQLIAGLNQEESQEARNVGEFLAQLSTALKQAMAEAMQTRIGMYQRFIESLLACPKGDEMALIESSSDLLDLGLLEVMGQTAGSLLVRGQSALANFLLYWVQEIGVKLGVYERLPQGESKGGEPALQSSMIGKTVKELIGKVVKTLKQPVKLPLSQTTGEPEQKDIPISSPSTLEQSSKPAVPDVPYLLLRLLQIISDQRDKKIAFQACYQILSSQKVTVELASQLRQWSEALFPQITTEQAIGVAYDIGMLGQMFMGCPIGDTAVNLEIAIAAMEISLTKITDDVNPYLWASLNHNLAICYSDATLRDKAESQEFALHYYQLCLQFYKVTEHPHDWAMIQNNLGLLYRDRIREDKSINIELAIACFQSALEAYTRQSQPRLWAVTQTNLGQTYEIRIQGDRIENLDKAIRAYRQALTVLNDKELSQQRRQVEQLLMTAESKLLAERKRALMEVNDSGILIGETYLSVREIAQNLIKYNLMFELTANIYIDNLIKDIEYSQADVQEGYESLAKIIADPAQKQQWMAERGMGEADLEHWVTRKARLEKFKHKMFAHKLETYFLERKSSLDQIRYYLIRHEDADLIKELYFRIQDKDQDIELLASEYGQGDESAFGGLIGPVELGHLPPALAQILVTASAGDTIGPLNLGNQWAVIRIKQVVSAKLDEAMRQRLLDELFRDWLKEQLKESNLSTD